MVRSVGYDASKAPCRGNHETVVRQRGAQTEMKRELRVLIVEDMAADVVLINRELRRSGLRFRSRRVDSRDAFLHELEHHRPDVILSDHGVPGFNGFAALSEARALCPEVPFIFVTGAPGEQASQECLKSGADDYVLKDSLNLLASTIDRAMRDSQTRSRHHELELALRDAEEHLRLISLEFKEYAAFMLDAECRVATWNPGAEEIFRYRPEEILGRDFSMLFAQEDEQTQGPLQMAAEATAHGRAEQSGWRMRKGGERFRANHVLVPVPGRGGKRGFFCVVRALGTEVPGNGIIKLGGCD